MPVKRLEILDSLRGLSALIVVFHHLMAFQSSLIKTKVSESVFDTFLYLSNLNSEAVLFFFVLSGFCIALAQKDKVLFNKESINLYLYKRFKRILPIYWLALVLSFVVGLIIHRLNSPHYSILNLFGNLTFLQTSKIATNYWFSPYGENGPLWSLAYEFFFYLFFIVHSLLSVRISIFRKGSVIIVSYLFLSLFCIMFNKHFLFIPIFAFLSLFIIWIAGYMAAELYIYRKKQDILFLSLFIFSTTTFIFFNQIPSVNLKEIIIGLFISSLFYFFIRFSSLWENPFLSSIVWLTNKLFAFIGNGSYALYALHYPLLILMSYFNTKLEIQIMVLLLLIFSTPYLEISVCKRNWLMFKRKYLMTN